MTASAGEDDPEAVTALARRPIAERITLPTPETVRETRLAAQLPAVAATAIAGHFTTPEDL